MLIVCTNRSRPNPSEDVPSGLDTHGRTSCTPVTIVAECSQFFPSLKTLTFERDFLSNFLPLRPTSLGRSFLSTLVDWVSTS